MLSQILSDWRSPTTLNQLYLKWKLCGKPHGPSYLKFLHILCFNVRGIDLRWGEVCLLAGVPHFSVMILGEVCRFDSLIIGAALPNYHYFYQRGENAHGGILVLVPMGIHALRVTCLLPNNLSIDLHLEKPIRVIAIYTPESKPWKWSDISCLLMSHCVIMDTLKVDLEKDGNKTERLLE